MSILLLVTTTVLIGATALGQGDVSQVTFSTPTAVVELDAGKLKGSPTRLVWAPEGDALYVQTRDKDGLGPVVRHHLVNLATREVKTADAEPAWASRSWQAKSAQSPPWAPALRIAVKEEKRQVGTTAAPMGGGLARGSPDAGQTGASAGEVTSAAQTVQQASVWTLTFQGEWIGEWVNTPVTPGTTFGWSPVGLKMIAFVDREGRLTLMDDGRHKVVVGGTRDALLPAWSDDGRCIAYAERTGRKKVTLRMFDVAAR